MWTEARFNGFIRSVLRQATRKWKPISDCKKEAWVSRGVYLCNGCKKKVKLTLPDKQKNVFVDHIHPVVDPKKGFESWDVFIERLFCEKDNLQVLCKACHDTKTEKEKELRKLWKTKSKKH